MKKIYLTAVLAALLGGSLYAGNSAAEILGIHHKHQQKRHAKAHKWHKTAHATAHSTHKAAHETVHNAVSNTLNSHTRGGHTQNNHSHSNGASVNGNGMTGGFSF
jgi:membrane protein involved in colicin uptake